MLFYVSSVLSQCCSCPVYGDVDVALCCVVLCCVALLFNIFIWFAFVCACASSVKCASMLLLVICFFFVWLFSVLRIVL